MFLCGKVLNGGFSLFIVVGLLTIHNFSCVSFDTFV